MKLRVDFLFDSKYFEGCLESRQSKVECPIQNQMPHVQQSDDRCYAGLEHDEDSIEELDFEGGRSESCLWR